MALPRRVEWSVRDRQEYTRSGGYSGRSAGIWASAHTSGGDWQWLYQHGASLSSDWVNDALALAGR